MKVYAIIDDEDDTTIAVLTEEQRDEFLRKFPKMEDVYIKPFVLGNINGIHIDDAKPFMLIISIVHVYMPKTKIMLDLKLSKQ